MQMVRGPWSQIVPVTVLLAPGQVDALTHLGSQNQQAEGTHRRTRSLLVLLHTLSAQQVLPRYAQDGSVQLLALRAGKG